jgi:NAD(P)-dependent dehydrogenase (short-subunit alcohol dehydrogenase family)
MLRHLHHHFNPIIRRRTSQANTNLLFRSLIDKTIELFGQIDVLILNAGISAHFLFEDINNMEVFKKLMDVNFFGCVYPTRYALPHLK